jgi:hypothetical protein
MTDKHLPEPFRFLELFGFKFELDWDDSLIITPPERAIDNDRVMFVLNQCTKQITGKIVDRRRRDMRQCVGGPFNGQSHDHWPFSSPVIARRVSRGRWAAYRVEKDGRAFYVGEATNEKKARTLAWATVPGKVDP